MTENEAIKEIKHEVCGEKGKSKLCHDKCMYGKEKCAYSMAIEVLEEIQQYRAIGTVEECREAREKHIPKKRIKGKMYKALGYYQCPVCGGMLTTNKRFCEDCGQAIDWRDTN